MIDMVNGKLTEKKYRDYTPLTEEQKKDMTEKQIELWEEKAKSGLLRGDTILSGATNQMRTDFTLMYLLMENRCNLPSLEFLLQAFTVSAVI